MAILKGPEGWPSVLLARAGTYDPDGGLADAERAGAWSTWKKLAPSTSPASIIRTIGESDLRGRGGAGYPTAEKWRKVAAAEADRRYVVANGYEADPGALARPDADGDGSARRRGGAGVRSVRRRRHRGVPSRSRRATPRPCGGCARPSAARRRRATSARTRSAPASTCTLSCASSRALSCSGRRRRCCGPSRTSAPSPTSARPTRPNAASRTGRRS